MRQHPAIGERILRSIPGLGGVARIVRHEHERFDGGGYPDGLSGSEIPIGSRIILACDAYHAMTSDRPYRKAMEHAAAVRELAASAGTQFDPEVTEQLIGCLYGQSQSGQIQRSGLSDPRRRLRRWPSPSPPPTSRRSRPSAARCTCTWAASACSTGTITRETVVQRLRERIHLIPRYTMRLESAPLGLANPAVDGGRVVRRRPPRAPRRRFPRPGGDAELCELVGPGAVRAARPRPPAVAADGGRGAAAQADGHRGEDAPRARGRPGGGGREHGDPRPHPRRGSTSRRPSRATPAERRPPRAASTSSPASRRRSSTCRASWRARRWRGRSTRAPTPRQVRERRGLVGRAGARAAAGAGHTPERGDRPRAPLRARAHAGSTTSRRSAGPPGRP